LVLGWLRKKDASLNELAHSAGDIGIRISASALQARLGKEAVMLLAGVLQLALEDLRKPCPLPLKQLEGFQGIYVTDSSQIALPAHLSSLFRGNQANSMVKLQVVWDYLHGHLAAVELEEGRQPDQKCTLQVSHALAGSLQLFDLGYFKQEYLRDIQAQGAYFVSRYQSQTALYAVDEESAFELLKWLKHLQANEAETVLLLGGRVKLPLRLLVRRLTPQAAQMRRRKAKQKARQQGKTCSAAYLTLLAWDILLTNLPDESWSLPHVFDVYPIRFQIEWLFRIWKDQLGLHKLADWTVERILCQLYAHIIGAIVCHLLTAAWRWGEFEYSFLKAVQIIQSAVQGLMRCLAQRGWGFAAWLNRLGQDFRQFARKTQRRKSPSTTSILYNWGLS
jgi:DDE family transposase